jgi:catechol 2,3-dioxygenase-like lactoylglutathione lyase family enzyme
VSAAEERPRFRLGLRHVALTVKAFEACERFYVELLGMAVEWRPDADNLYLNSGRDNLALHRAPSHAIFGRHQHLDHIGFAVHVPGEVDRWHTFLAGHGVPMKSAPRTHRDGARSFYCSDPDGNSVQIIYHPPLAGAE